MIKHKSISIDRGVSSRTSLASRTSSRTHFEVLGLGLEASSPWKLACPRLEDNTFFFFFWDRLKNFCEDLFFGELLRLCPWSLALSSSIPVLGLESVCPRKGCPWLWPRIFFVSLILASSLVSSTPPLSIDSLDCILQSLFKCCWTPEHGYPIFSIFTEKFCLIL